MSNRTLIEINHDFTAAIADDQFVRSLRRYLASGDSMEAEALRGFGVRVIAMRHHTENYNVPAGSPGFPADGEKQ